jgi:hypothetical protein
MVRLEKCSFAPPGLDRLTHSPTAYAVGYILSPLRGLRSAVIFQLVQNEGEALVDGTAREFYKFVAGAGVDAAQGFASLDCLIPSLLAFTVLGEDLGPGWSEKDAAVVTESLDGFEHVRGDG